MKTIFSDNCEHKEEVLEFIDEFEKKGTVLDNGARNTIKIFDTRAGNIAIKSFKIPNVINKVSYRFFRKSKAERSFEYAQHLLANHIGTPVPIAYAEEVATFTFNKSFYVSEYLQSDLTYRELIQESDLSKINNILRAFTRFTFELHEKEIEFLDHSPGNTLIQLNDGDYKFFLVDLNRMNFRVLNFEQRMKNFSRLTSKKEIIAVMANEYAKVSLEPEGKVFERMWFHTGDFQRKFRRKKKIKKRLKFWKK